MPRKTSRPGRRPRPEKSCFNEAAARCRGKHRGLRRAAEAARAASMRPRPDAAENGCAAPSTSALMARFNEAAARCRGKRWRPASPRPSHGRRFNEAAARCRGKRRPRLAGRPDRAGASMRPRPDAAENPRHRVPDRRDVDASMRPRPDAAENFFSRGRRCRPMWGFNEAAARCRGKLTRHDTGVDMDGKASMRPRPDAAENLSVAQAFDSRRLLQ